MLYRYISMYGAVKLNRRHELISKLERIRINPDEQSPPHITIAGTGVVTGIAGAFTCAEAWRNLEPQKNGRGNFSAEAEIVAESITLGK